MADEKHPVSHLQELMAKQNKPLPYYHTIQSNTSYICTVVVDGITTMAKAASKRDAKLEAAKKAVRMLESQSKTTPRLSSKETLPLKLQPRLLLVSPDTFHMNYSSSSSLNTSSSQDLISFEDEPSPPSSSSNYPSNQDLLGIAHVSSPISKHPISELQEIMAKQRKPEPEYVVKASTIGNYPSFHCSLTIDGISFESQTLKASKQAARQEVAEYALKYLRKCSFHTSSNSPTSHRLHNVTDHNAVGILNEYLQRNGASKATYQQMGANSEGQYIVLCSVTDKTTQGCHVNKKLAKQEAAHNMNKLLKVYEEGRIPLESKKPMKLRADEEVLRKYYEIVNTDIKLSTDDQKNVTLANTSEKNLRETTSDLIKHLDGLNISYKGRVVQQEPFSAYLDLEDSLPITICGTGETSEEAYVDALKKACKLKQPNIL